MNDIFKPYLRKLFFFDNILVYSPSYDQHLVHLKTTFKTLKQHTLFSKCSFGTTQVEYLGHIITIRGVSIDPKKVSVMTDWPWTKTVKELRGFLGLTGYYRKCDQRYRVISKPLTSPLKKDSFQWNVEAQAAFETLKEAMAIAPLLALPDFTKTFVVETDATGEGIGAVLMRSPKTPSLIYL